MDEKRLHKRIKKSIKCEVHSDGLTFSSTIDVGRGGIFISTPEPLLAESEIELVLYMPDNEPMELKARVTWVRDDDSDDVKAGMGVEFLNATEAQIAAIESFAAL